MESRQTVVVNAKQPAWLSYRLLLIREEEGLQCSKDIYRERESERERERERERTLVVNITVTLSRKLDYRN